MPGGAQRNPRSYGGAVAGLALDVNATVKKINPLAQTHQSEGHGFARILRIEAAAVVANGQYDAPTFLLDSHLDESGPCMFGNVGQRLLQDPVDCDGMRVRKVFAGWRHLETAIDVRPLLEILDQPFDRRPKAQVVEHQ